LPSKTYVSLRDAARRDSAVHVSLSSDSPVKQPGTRAVPPPGEPESRRSLWPPIEIGCLVPNIIDELQTRATSPSQRRAKLARYICVRTALCQRPTGRKSTLPVQSGNNHLLK